MTDVHVLKNGVRVVADRMPSLESAAIGVWAGAGTIDETLEQHGAAHLLEHMAFKGTKRRSARAIVEEIESVGGYLNAATSYQRTGYYGRVLRDDVETAFDLLADILTGSLISDADLAKEKEVVVQEIGEAWDAPDDAVHEILQSLSYGDHALARPILGTIDSVRAQTPDGLRRFMADHYVGANMVVAASGAVSPDDVYRWAEKYFGGVDAGGPKKPTLKPTFHSGARREDREIEQTHIAIAFPGVGARDEAAFSARVFAEILGGGMSSRLFQKVREENGLAYSVYAYSENYADIGTLGVSLGTDRGAAGAAARLIRTEIEEMTRNLDHAELNRARAILRSNLLMGLESPVGRAEAAASQLFVFGRLLPVEEIRERLDAVTREDIKAEAARALSGAACVAVVGPGDLAAIEDAVRGR